MREQGRSNGGTLVAFAVAFALLLAATILSLAAASARSHRSDTDEQVARARILAQQNLTWAVAADKLDDLSSGLALDGHELKACEPGGACVHAQPTSNSAGTITVRLSVETGCFPPGDCRGPIELIATWPTQEPGPTLAQIQPVG